MKTKIETILKSNLKKGLPDIRPGDTIKVVQKVKEGDKERKVTFEGMVISRKHGKEIGSTITVRKVISGIGIEKTFPIHSSTIEKIKVLKRGKVRRAKLYYLRKVKGKKARIRKTELKKEGRPTAETKEGKEEPEEKTEKVKEGK